MCQNACQDEEAHARQLGFRQRCHLSGLSRIACFQDLRLSSSHTAEVPGLQPSLKHAKHSQQQQRLGLLRAELCLY